MAKHGICGAIITLLLPFTIGSDSWIVAYVGPVTQKQRSCWNTKLATPTRVAMAGPLFKGDDYKRTVEGIMTAKGLTKEEAEKDYNAFLANPNNYALDKMPLFLDQILYNATCRCAQGEEYYKKLGYKSLMDGVIGEAEKQGRGEEVRARIAAFKKKSQLKAYAVIGTAILAFSWYKMQYDMGLGNPPI